MAADNDPLIGKKLGDYIIVDVLGQGGMARVYRGLDKKLNRYAAVKVIDVHLIGEEQEEYRQRFTNEARSIAKLTHPGIVGIYQFDQVGTTYYMAMQFIEGKDLRMHLRSHAKNGTRMSYPEIRRIIRDVADALDYAHREGVIHRDIKPSNIMVTTEGRAILTDFGLALQTTEGTIGNTFGSAHYIAPEQAVSSAQAVAQSDLYSLGVVMFEMLTNRVPFNDPSAMAVAMKHLNEPAPPPSRLNPNLSPKVDEVVMKAMDKDPKKRYPTGAALVTALDFAFAITGDGPGSDGPVMPLPSWDSNPSKSSRPSAMQRPSDSRVSRTGLDGWESPSRTSRPYLEDNPTVTDSKKSAASRAQIEKIQRERNQRTSRTRTIGILAMLGIIAIAVGAGILIGSNGGGGGSNDATETPNASPIGELAAASLTAQAQALAMFATAKPTEVPTENTAEVAATDTVEATIVRAEPTDTPPPLPTNTTAPSPTPAPPSNTPEPSPTLTETPSLDAPVLLRWDGNSLNLLNQSNETVDVSGLIFVQSTADRDLTFESRLWNGGSRPTDALPAGACFGIVRDDGDRTDTPNYCTARHALWQASFARWFWISDDPTATFEVQRDGVVLATCRIADGECSFDPTGGA